MCNYILEEKTKKKNLWGGLIENDILSDLKSIIEEDNDKEIIIDLKGIETIDYSFINNIFINLLKTFNKKRINIVFKNIENSSIQYYLTKSFSENNFTARIIEDKEIFSI